MQDYKRFYYAKILSILSGISNTDISDSSRLILRDMTEELMALFISDGGNYRISNSGMVELMINGIRFSTARKKLNRKLGKDFIEKYPNITKSGSNEFNFKSFDFNPERLSVENAILMQNKIILEKREKRIAMKAEKKEKALERARNNERLDDSIGEFVYEEPESKLNKDESLFAEIDEILKQFGEENKNQTFGDNSDRPDAEALKAFLQSQKK